MSSPGTNSDLVLVGEWSTTDPSRQCRAAEAAMTAWQTVRWPTGLRSHSCFLGTDGQTVLHHERWSDESASRRFVSTGRPRWLRAVHEAAPDIEHRGVVGYRPYRHVEPVAGGVTPGCLVTVVVDFVDASSQRQRDWVDGVFAAAAADSPRPAGLLSASFHLSVDGTRVLNLAEWTDEVAHRDAADAPVGPVRGATRGAPGVRNLSFRRWSPYRRRTRDTVT